MANNFYAFMQKENPTDKAPPPPPSPSPSPSLGAVRKADTQKSHQFQLQLQRGVERAANSLHEAD